MPDTQKPVQATTRPQLVVERDGGTVTITARGLDPAEARRVYRAAVDQAREGRVVLLVNTIPRPVIVGEAEETLTLEGR